MSSTDHAERLGAITRETILAVLVEHFPDGVSTRKLAYETGRSAPAVVKQLHALRASGLVERIGTLGPGVRYTLGPATLNGDG